MEKTFEIRIPGDTEGFVSLCCTLCDERFKLRAADAQADDVLQLFCPGCGIAASLNTFLPREVLDAALRVATNEVTKVINEFGRSLERSFRNSSHVSITRSRDLPYEAEKVLIEQDDLERVDLSCCTRSLKVRHTRKAGVGYCPYCGVNW